VHFCDIFVADSWVQARRRWSPRDFFLLAAHNLKARVVFCRHQETTETRINMNINFLSRVPFCIVQSLLIRLLKEREFSDALTLLEAFPTLATTQFPTKYQYTCFDDLLRYLCEDPDYDIEDEAFMNILIFPYKRHSNDLDLTEKQLHLLRLSALLRHAGKKSAIFKCFIRDSQSNKPLFTLINKYRK